jgi:YesN/AraC family two-component response regulator
MNSSSPDHTAGILIVEDDPYLRSFLRTALETEVRVFEASDCERAIEILRNRAGTDLDLVLTDYKLPHRSGLELLVETKQNWPWIAVVFLTGFGSEDLAVQAFRHGASDYLTKPVQLDALVRTVGKLVTAGASGQRRGRGAGVTDPRIAWALKFLHEHFAEPMPLARIAMETNLSRFHFCRLFRRDTGRRFHDYIEDLRLTRAKTLLADDQLSVAQVASTVGFNRLSHFDKRFRKVVGQSPTEYRRSQRPAE